MEDVQPPFVNEWWGWDDDRWRTAGPSAPIRLPPHEPDWWTDIGCCVDCFLYPARLEIMGDNSPPRVGFTFDAYMKFNDEGYCLCACCESRQYVKVSWSHTTLAGENSYRSADHHIEDCTYDAPDGGGGTTIRSVAFDGPPPPGTKVYCYGTEDDDRRVRQLSAADKSNRSNNPCVLWMYNNPQFTPAVGTFFWVKWDFLGRVYDVCNNNTVRAEGRIVVEPNGHGGRGRSHLRSSAEI